MTNVPSCLRPHFGRVWCCKKRKVANIGCRNVVRRIFNMCMAALRWPHNFAPSEAILAVSHTRPQFSCATTAGSLAFVPRQPQEYKMYDNCRILHCGAALRQMRLHFPIKGRFICTTVRSSRAGSGSAVGNVSGYRSVSDCRSRGCEFDPGPVPYFRGDWSWNDFYGDILLPSADSFKKGCCQLQAKVCARITG